MTEEYKRKLEQALARIYMLKNQDNPDGVEIMVGEDEDGQALPGYVDLYDGTERYTLREQQALDAAEQAEDPEEFWRNVWAYIESDEEEE